jgi:hypothetical protein
MISLWTMVRKIGGLLVVQSALLGGYLILGEGTNNFQKMNQLKSCITVI